jgi:hypothetical protein
MRHTPCAATAIPSTLQQPTGRDFTAALVGIAGNQLQLTHGLPSGTASTVTRTRSLYERGRTKEKKTFHAPKKHFSKCFFEARNIFVLLHGLSPAFMRDLKKTFQLR